MIRKRITSWICAGLAAVLLVTGSFPVYAAGSGESGTESEELSEARENLADAQEEIDDIKAQRKSAQQRLDSLKADKADLEAYIKELDQNLTEVQDTIDRLAAAMEAKQAEIADTQAALETTKASEKSQYEAMKLRIQFMYEAGDIQYLEILFEAKSLTDFLNRVEYITAIIKYDRDKLEEYQQTCQDIADTEAALQQEYIDLEQLKQVNEESKADLETLMEAKNAELSSFTAQINSVSAEVNSYSKALKEQENLIAQIEEEIKRQEEEARRKQEEEEKNNSGSDNTSSSLNFIWPIPDSSRITSKFGPRKAPVAGASDFHKGVDVGAPTGTKIYAAASGTVVIAQYNYSAGNYIMINHGNGVYTVYMHCSKLLVKVGDEVKQGDNIGLVGSTGYSTGPHLHFGVRIDGEYKDPLNYVSAP